MKMNKFQLFLLVTLFVLTGCSPMTSSENNQKRSELDEIAAKDIPMERSGTWCAGQVLSYRRDNALVVVDLGGGYGGPVYEHLNANEIETQGYKGSEGTTRRSRDGTK